MLLFILQLVSCQLRSIFVGGVRPASRLCLLLPTIKLADGPVMPLMLDSKCLAAAFSLLHLLSLV